MRKLKALKKRVLEGVVVSDKMDKTRVVTIRYKLSHPIYGRLVSKRKKLKIHDENNQAKVGDRVRIVEGRPHSKEKRFTLLEVVR